MAQENESLTEFVGWETTSEEVDFFGEIATVDVVDTTKEVVRKANADDGDIKSVVEEQTDEQKKIAAEKAAKELEDNTFFGVSPGEEDGVVVEEEEEINPEEEEEEPILTGSISALNTLKEKGYLEYELEEGEEMTEELAAEIIEDNYEAGVETRIKELFEDLPQVVKDLNSFALKGGNVKQFFSAMAKNNTSSLTANLDMTAEANQELVVREVLKAEGEDADTIQTQIEFLKDSKKMAAYATKKFEKWNANRETERKQILEQQTQAKAAEKVARRKSKNTLATSLKEMKDVNGLSLTKADKKELPSYMVDRNVKLQNGSVITPMQRDLMTALQDEKKAAFIAKLLRNNFDLTDLKTTATTEVTKKVKAGVRRAKAGSVVGKSTKKGSSQKKGSLADFF